MKFSRNVRGGVLIDHIRFYVLAIAVGLIFSAVAATAATTISTNISTGGTLTATGLSTFGNASSTLFSAYGPAYFGATATSSFSSAGVLSLISALTVPNGGTGVSIFGQGWIYSSGGIGALTASTSPTVNYITATSTTVSSIFPYASTTALSSTGSAWFATSGGNVGIGTTSPWGKVSIENGVLTTPAFVVSTSTGNTAFTINTNGDARPYGRFLLPMGEVSYFSMTGTTTTMGGTSDGSTNMIVVSPASTLNSDMEFDNGGANNGRMRYTGETTKVFHIAVTLSGTPANANDVFVFGVAKNGTVVTASKVLGSSSGTQFSALHAMVTLSKNDYVELYVGNTTATRNITIKTLNIFAIGM